MFGLTFLSLRNCLVLISVNNQVTREGLRWNASNDGTNVFKWSPLEEAVTLKKKKQNWFMSHVIPGLQTRHSIHSAHFF